MEVQWFSSSGSGVRSYKLYGISKVHIRVADGLTACRVPIPRSRFLISSEPNDVRCKRCLKAVAQ